MGKLGGQIVLVAKIGIHVTGEGTKDGAVLRFEVFLSESNLEWLLIKGCISMTALIQIQQSSTSGSCSQEHLKVNKAVFALL